MSFHTDRLFTGSMPVVGSSMMMILGLPIPPMATESLRFMPPEKVRTREFSTFPRLTSASFCFIKAGMSLSGTPLRIYCETAQPIPQLGEKTQMLAGGEFAPEDVELRHQAYQSLHLRYVLSQIQSADVRRPRARPQDSCQDVYQRRLPRTVMSEQGNQLTLRDVQVYLQQG